MKKSPARIIAFGKLFTLCAHIAISSVSSAQSAMTSDDWRDDAKTLRHVLESVHPMPFARVNKESFDSEYTRLVRSIPKLSDNEVAIGLMRLVASLRDGHTILDPTGYDRFGTGWFPIRFYVFPDGVHITAISAQYQKYVGAKVRSIGESTVDEVFQATSELLGADNVFGARNNTFLMSNAATMEALGFVNPDGQMTITVETAGGHVAKFVLPRINKKENLNWRFFGEMFAPFWGNSEVSLVTAINGLSPIDHYMRDQPGLPLHMQYRRPFRVIYLEQSKTVYVALNNIVRTHDQSTFSAFVQSVFSLLDSQPTKKLILDIRYNSGGDGSIVKPIVYEIIKRNDLNQYGNIFVITGRKTFSAAINLLGPLVSDTRSITVGEPPSAHLNMFGNSQSHTLPNSGMTLNVSSAYFQLTDWSATPGRSPTVFPVDFPAVPTAVEYFGLKDPAIALIMGERELRPLHNIAMSESAKYLRQTYEQRTDDYNRFRWWKAADQHKLNSAGNRLLSDGQTERAIVALEINAEVFADWWKAWDSLAEAHWRNGDAIKAIEYYEKSLELNPGNSNAAMMIDRIAQNAKNK